ncbi:MBL fold metallo-hydrolase [Acidovorax sp. JHL-9]|uniref:MBL fold metallo-hydrolase n=1 Tax=Acidovorax sp. JHL-9 TaxID=1276756 RepID=UPI00042887AE|nr:MBL fold metallo-hydrolase [Acidovorax sp. JHL-9]
MLRFRSLGSGSSGNATVVEAGDGSQIRRLLVDCGFGIRQLATRLGAAGLGIDQIDAIFITHEHADHVGCAKALALRHRIPVWMSDGTHAALGCPDLDGLLQVAYDMVPIDLGTLCALPFTVPHDAREPLQLRCTDGASHLGLLTDLGHASSHVLQQLQGCHALLLEANHDPGMLEASSYPAFLKRRIGGEHGHLANHAAASILTAVQHAGLNRVVAAHLSAQNNQPWLAQQALAQALDWPAQGVDVASAVAGTEWIDVTLSR